MKHVILLFAMAVFAVMAISSCSLCRCDKSDLSIKCDKNDLPTQKVIIKTKGADARGNRPEVVPECVAVKYGTDQEVEWKIDREDLGFTVRFKKGKSPFRKHAFTKKENRSGRAMTNPGNSDKVYKYSIKVEGLEELDPIVIIWK